MIAKYIYKLFTFSIRTKFFGKSIENLYPIKYDGPIFPSKKMANRYAAGKIYKVFNKLDEKKFIIGSTILDLDRRFSTYKNHSDIVKTKGSGRPIAKYMNEIGNDNFEITLIENYPCNNRIELRMREQKFIDEMKPTFNKNKAYANPNDFCKLRKEAYDKYMNDPAKAKIQSERVKKWHSTQYTCKDCGITMNKGSKYKHLKTAKHLKSTDLQAKVLNPP